MMKRMYFLLILVSAMLASCTGAPIIEVELGSLDLKSFHTSWGETKTNLSVTNRPLTVAGKVYEKGVGTHASNEMYFHLDGKGGRFTALVGIDDNSDGGSVNFVILTEKDLVFESGVMKRGDQPKPVDIDLKGVKHLMLISDETSDGIRNDHANWLNAVFHVQTAPTVAQHEPEVPYILTPEPLPAPRITGARITGASAGKPFMFTLAATGLRPMNFTAKNLPEGLNIDGATGFITGTCNSSGKYLVPVEASNSAGTCRDTLEIHIGGGLAMTPHMGWNSWYIYQTGITQDIMERSAKAMSEHGLINFGYSFVNIDDGWEVRVNSTDSIIGGAVRNPDGTIRTNKNFPNMKKMTDYIHSLGLKAGLYSSPGHATCAGFAGSLGHEQQDVNTFDEWGFDFLKYDWCSYDREAKSQELDEYKKPYLLISEHLKNASRDIVLNLCQYGMADVWKWGKEVGGQSWRTTGDLGWDTQRLSESMFQIGFFQEQIRQYSGPNGWNDPDYLLFGKIWDWKNQKVVPSPYSPSEHYTCMTLWSMMPAPLIFSGDVITLDDFTKNILCNTEVIDINQDKLGKPGYCILNRGYIEIWKRELHDGNTAIAIFNRRSLQATVKMDWKELGYEGKYQVRDIWRQQDLGAISKIRSFDIPRHGCVMLKIIR